MMEIDGGVEGKTGTRHNSRDGKLREVLINSFDSLISLSFSLLSSGEEMSSLPRIATACE